MKKIEIELTLDDVDIIDDALEMYVGMMTPPRDEDGDDKRTLEQIAGLSKKINALREPLLFQEDA